MIIWTGSMQIHPTSAPTLPKHNLQMHPLKNWDGCDGPDYHQGLKAYLKETYVHHWTFKYVEQIAPKITNM